MKRGAQKTIAIKAGISPAFICQVLKGKKRPSWSTAKKLANATGTSAILWMEGGPDELRHALSKIRSYSDRLGAGAT